jgi:hypothetical protein
MVERQAPEGATLTITALMLLALGFAGYWIYTYASTGTHPWHLFWWFGGAAVAIVAVGSLLYLRRT